MSILDSWAEPAQSVSLAGTVVVVWISAARLRLTND
jgi:hypothetical protein